MIQGRQLGVFLGVFLLNAYRVTEGFRYPAFFAEDGAILFVDSITIGASSLSTPIVGHHCFLQRALAYIALQFPILWAPTLYRIFSGVVTAWCFSLFSRDGYRWMVPSDRTRIFLCFIFPFLPGAAEISFAVCTLYYPLLYASFLLLLEQDKESRWTLSVPRIFLLTTLWFSTGHAIVAAPLLAYLALRQRSSRHFACLLTLFVSVLGNVSAVVRVVGKYRFQSGNLFDRLSEGLRIWTENLLVRAVYQAVFGERIAERIIAGSDLLFWTASMLLVFLSVGFLFHYRGKHSFRLGDCRLHLLGIFLLSIFALCPLSVFVRSYTYLVYARPTMTLGFRYSFLPSICVLTVLSALVFQYPGERWRRWGPIVGVLWITWSFLKSPLFPEVDRHLEFEKVWPRQAAAIESALAKRSRDELFEPVVIGRILCLPVWWHDFDSDLTIYPNGKSA